MNEPFRYRFLGLFAVTSPQYTLTPINNTVGLFFYEEGTLKISNDKWTLLVYKDINPFKNAIINNDNTLEQIQKTIEENNPRTIAFKAQVQTHISLLKQISDTVNLKYSEILADTKNYHTNRRKRGLINGLGSIWKSISGNLDASDGEYFNDCIDKITQDQQQIETLLQKQISVTTSVIKNFNNTIQKLQIDEQTFNNDIEEIRSSILDISDDLAFYQAQVKTLDLCESLMESYVFIEEALDDILNAISFARLKILHSSIINPTDLVDSLQKISQSIHKNNLPLPIFSSSIAQYVDIIELEAFQLNNKIIFVLRIPLVDPETYILYHLYPIPILDDRTGLHHILTSTKKYVARNDDSLLYASFRNLDNCKQLSRSQKVCSDVLPYPIDSDSACEAQLLKQLHSLPKTCQTSLLYARDYNVQEINTNLWLITISEPLPVSVKCQGRDVVTKNINANSVLKLQPECKAFIGNTRVHAKKTVDYQNFTYRSHPVEIPFNCCTDIPSRNHIPELKPLRLNNIDAEDLNIAQHKLNQYSDELDRLIHQPFVKRHISWFTYVTIAFVISLVALYFTCKCQRRRNQTKIDITVPKDSPPEPPREPLTQLRNNLSRIIPRRRSSAHLQQPIEEMELNCTLQKSKP